jgi:hypothetical protein
MLRFSVIQVIVITLILGSCSPTRTAPTNPPPPTLASQITTPLVTAQAIDSQSVEPVGKGVNPLTGLPVADPSLLQIPAVLLSISHFPATARPQAGLSFAPFVFEIYITEGATRFLATFYGEWPAPEVPLVGNCDVRREPFIQTKLVLGNQVWLDSNGNNIHEPWERGVGGVCVNLYDVNDNLLQQTTTDSNGFYAFNVDPGKYLVAFLPPPGMAFVQKDAGSEESDSDVDPATGYADPVEVTSSFLDLDAGLTVVGNVPATANLPEAKVGPVRSGRMVYRHIAAFFPDSCLIYAFASPEVLKYLPKCLFVTHDVQGGGYMLEIKEMIKYAKASKKKKQKIDYTSNIFSSAAPEGGMDASKLHVDIAWLNQSEWVYDAASESWWRYVDTSEPDMAGILHPEIDRLTGRQLHFENVIVLFAMHEVISPTNLEIHLDQDWVGDALLLRDGKMYKIRWSTVATDEEIQSGRRTPIKFYYPDEKTRFPLKPGHTWILVVTPETSVAEQAHGQWLLQFYQPPGAK